MQIGGLVVTGLGVWALVDKVPWIGELVGNDLLTGAVYVLLVGGIVVAFIAFFGCIGASREVKCMLLTVSIKDLFLNRETVSTDVSIFSVHIIWNDEFNLCRREAYLDLIEY